ncbi:hypothetical protein SASPL_150395 [Salvia splendens]|uniref:Uncharacterized protein n=1 Tax=Salvia splendens TaxID=180675 RepID=A0A8X8W647_SALSN|nr:hypothetical protein SASPL_150395 [Salvia splendens]
MNAEGVHKKIQRTRRKNCLDSCMKMRCGDRGLRSIHPGWLLAFRVFAFLMLLLMLILNVAVDGGSIFNFYTQWTFTLITIYFGGNLDHFCQFVDAMNMNERGYAEEHSDTEHGKGKERNQQQIVRQEAGCLAYIFQIIFQLIINMHSINAGFLARGNCSKQSKVSRGLESDTFFCVTCTYVSVSMDTKCLCLDMVFNCGIDANTMLRHLCANNEREAFLSKKWFPESYWYAHL